MEKKTQTYLLRYLLVVVVCMCIGCGDDSDDTDTNDTTFGDSSADDVPTGPPDLSTDIAELDVIVGTDAYVPCAPDCSQKVCGPDGCGGICGECFIGEECSADWRCVSLEGKQPFGAACGPMEGCEAWLTTESGRKTNPDYPECLNTQCASGICDSVGCTKNCAFIEDSINNHTQSEIPDGIEDPQHNSCAGAAADGPFGGKYRCVNTTAEGLPPVTQCIPGATLAPCDSDKHCDEGETCTVVTILGASETRCTAKVVNGKSVGSLCDSGKAGLPFGLCQSSALCALEGCTTICTTDSECRTANATCSNNHCQNNPAMECEADTDCSAWKCDPVDPKIAPDTLIKGLCIPKSCARDLSCIDPQFFCQMNVAIDDSGLAAWAHECRETPTDTNATLGDTCTNNPTDAIVCDNPDLCYKGQCSTLCESDNDCNTSADQICAIAEIAYDVDADQTVDILLPLSLCEGIPHQGELTDCKSNNDCTVPGEICAPLEIPATVGNFPYLLKRTCRTTHPDFGGYGDDCGTAPGEGECAIGFCTVDDQFTAKTMCSQTCNEKADCPNITVDGKERPSICRSVRLGANGSFAPEDDLFVPICWPVGPGSSRDDCKDDFICKNPKETCVPWAIATGPGEAGKVEYSCISSLGPDAIKGKGKVGEECNTHADCESLTCIDDLAGKKICTGLCKKDSDCLAGGPYMVCDDHVLIPRPNKAQSLTVPQCRKAQTCIGCTTHMDCAKGMKCIRSNFASSKYICAHPCTNSDDCKNTDGGSLCKTSLGANGPDDIFKSCAPSLCP
ncbi:MAG: hypothetical protein HUU55_04050 [Myxococcales bacterium]|nr:hypothetical protein [Myxococcales bacterium]